MEKKHLKRLAEILGLPLRVLEAGIDTLTKELQAEEAKSEERELTDEEVKTLQSEGEDVDSGTTDEPSRDETPVQAGEVTNDSL